MAKNSGLGKGLDALFAAPIALEGFNEEEQKIDEKNNDIVKSANKSKTLLEQISRKDNKRVSST